MSLSYWTPEGQAVTQAMQPKQASKCWTIESVIGAPCSPAFIRSIRPRGESISSPHSVYVGQVGRQKPQCTQSSSRFSDGGWSSSNAGRGASSPRPGTCPPGAPSAGGGGDPPGAPPAREGGPPGGAGGG